jgi:hypothetical protein
MKQTVRIKIVGDEGIGLFNKKRIIKKDTKRRVCDEDRGGV